MIYCTADNGIQALVNKRNPHQMHAVYYVRYYQGAILYLDSDWSQIKLAVVEVLHSWLVSVSVLVEEESLDDAALAHFWASDDHQSYPLVSHL